jgi:predicted dehydrogenase/threonine dehydrogenase-like Zn-dependent dehydrogenase
MKQLLQSLRDGSTELCEVPAPSVSKGQNLIRTSTSLVSAGTERMLVEFGKSNLIQKARSQPDKVKMVLAKAKTDGVVATIDAVRSKLDQPITLGYCNVGTIIDAQAEGFAAGDRVVSNGQHAEIVLVSKHLCARIPDNVSDEAASFTVLAAIGLQGIRLAQPTIGEAVVVAGLGLIGLLTVQMLRAQGCRVLGIDFDPKRLELARSFGADTLNLGAGENVLSKAEAFSRGAGVDAVIITAATPSNEPISQAAKMCRKRGRIILVGVVGLDLSRADFYEKELTFQVSCSYGPGRYDSNYENKGQDYPVGYVRWTEQRNFEAVLDLIASGALQLEPLISHRFDLSEGKKAMELITSDEPALGILLQYPRDEAFITPVRRVSLLEESETLVDTSSGRVAFLGSGNYASRVLIPAFKAAGASLQSVVSSGGISSVHFGNKFGFKDAATDVDAILSDEKIDTIVIATRHNLHAKQVLSALDSGKHVFCEKPLCLTLDELEVIQIKASQVPSQNLMVGFNRRFAPQIVKMKELLTPLSEPKSIVITVNAGYIPPDHWTHDKAIGGGRIIGEVCHFIDLARHLVGYPITNYEIVAMQNDISMNKLDDNVSFTLQFTDGSVATVLYMANGERGFPKERIEVFVAGRVLQLDNFLKLRGWGWDKFKKMNLWRQDKGVDACVTAFLSGTKGKAPIAIPTAEIIEISRCSIELAEALR